MYNINKTAINMDEYSDIDIKKHYVKKSKINSPKIVNYPEENTKKNYQQLKLFDDGEEDEYQDDVHEPKAYTVYNKVGNGEYITSEASLISHRHKQGVSVDEPIHIDNYKIYIKNDKTDGIDPEHEEVDRKSLYTNNVLLQNGNSIFVNANNKDTNKRHTVALKCPNKECMATLSRENYGIHLERCDFQIFMCIHCHFEGNFYQITNHVKYNCELIFSECVHCKEKYSIRKIKHHLKICDHQLESCLYCEKDIMIKDIPMHIEHVCEKNSLECKFCLMRYNINYIKEHETKKEECRNNIINSTKLKMKDTFEYSFVFLFEELNNLGKTFIKEVKPQQAIKSLSKAVDIIDKFYNNSPVLQLEKLKRKDSSPGTKKRSLSLSKKINDITSIEISNCYSLIAKCNLKLRHVNDSIINYKNAIRINSNNDRAFNNLGNIYFYNQDINLAKFYFKKAIGINPSVSEYYFNLGNAIFDEENYLEAKGCYQKSLELNPDHSPSYKALGDLYYNTHMLPEAIYFYRIAIEKDENNEFAYLGLGDCYSKIKRFCAACESYETAIYIDPNMKEAYNNLGELYIELTDIEKAIECFQKSLYIDPNYNYALNNLKVAFVLKEHYKKK